MIRKFLRSIDDQDNIQQLLSPLKRLKTTTTTPMETNNEVTAKTESVKTNSKSGYLVKVIHKKKRNSKLFKFLILGLRYYRRYLTQYNGRIYWNLL